MAEVQCARNWAKIRSKSIDSSKQFPSPNKTFLPPLYSEDADDEDDQDGDVPDSTSNDVETLEHWIEHGATSQSDFRRGSSPFHMSLMSDMPPVPIIPFRRPPKLQKRFSSLPETSPLSSDESSPRFSSKIYPHSRNSPAELLRKRRKQLESLHKMRLQEEYFDSLFEKNEARLKEEEEADNSGEDSSTEGSEHSSTTTEEMTVLRNDQKVEELYDFKEVLGSGRFGKVTLVIEKSSGKEFAAKQMACRRPAQRKEYEAEVTIMKQLRHPLLISCKDAFIEGRTATLVLELVTGGELFDRISDENFDLTEEMATKYLQQILQGINYMHMKSILHLDIKPENVLCLSKDKLDQIKIIDFGFARHYNPGNPPKLMFGTPEFVAPEVVNFESLGKGTDVWSIGVLAYVMVSGLSPFMGDNEQETLTNVSLAELDFDDDVFDDVSEDAKEFIVFLLAKNERERPTCKQCLNHKWLKQAEQKRKSEKETESKKLLAARGNLRKFIARRRLQRSINAVRAITRLSISLKRASMDHDDAATKSPPTVVDQPEKIVEVDEKTEE